MPIAWEHDPADAPQLAANATRVLSGIARAADRRDAPTVALAQQWHRDLHEAITRPVDYYAGQVRDCNQNFPDLIGYEVQVGSASGVPAAQVPAALQRFQQATQTAAVRLDNVISVGAAPAMMAPAELHGVLTYCAALHGSWVRIHPFANGNGRTARLWADWAALRYGIPPFVAQAAPPAPLRSRRGRVDGRQ